MPSFRRLRLSFPLTMRALNQINLGVRTQAVLVFTVVLLWFISIPGWAREMGNPHAFWTGAFLSCPFLSAGFAAVLVSSYRRAGGVHRRWVLAALWVAAAPWVLSLLFFGIAWASG